MIKLAISGCCGRMGQRIIALAHQDKQLKITGALEQTGHPAVGKKLAEVIKIDQSEIKVSDSPDQIKGADVLIEFTDPAATIKHLASAVKYKTAMVIGTTALNAQHLEKIKQAASDIAIVFSPNMSLGVNLVFKLIKQAAQKLGLDYQVDITEAHHVHKKDAPSGTAKRLADLIKQSRGSEDEAIKIDSIREGEIVGEHQVRFDGPSDVVTIKHSAKTRDIFAQGALEAAKFAAKQKSGFYDMQDVIG
ncbi:MAG: 4-hydroxy-tetrahydrodipicolinate reductase [Candidatus Omnitrophica bacterium]|nr:4-hydroxy-tetrahydrodipicolinate reductase [Candidatus Omnitrophota bacterium]